MRLFIDYQERGLVPQIKGQEGSKVLKLFTEE